MNKYIKNVVPASGGSGGGSITSVNGQTGVVVLDTQDLADIPFITVLPADGDVGVQAAVDAAATAGGGVVQLLEGTYVFADEVVWPTGASGVIVRGVGDGTVIESTLTGNTYPFNISYNPGSLLDRACGNTTRLGTSVTCTTAAQAAPFTVGMPVLIKGLDADGFNRQEVNEVAIAGNAGTGVIGLKSDIRSTLTSVTITGWDGGIGNGVKDLKVIHTSGASHVVRFDYQWNSFLDNLTLDGTGFSAAYSLHITKSVYPKITNIDNLNYNVIETEGMVTAAKGMEIANVYGLTMENCLLFNNGEGTINSGALFLTNLEHCLFDGVDIVGSNYNGMVFSAGTSSVDIVFNNCSITNSAFSSLISSGNTKDVTFTNCNFIQNQQSDLILTCRDWKFVGCNFLENSDTGSDETAIFQGGTRISFIGCAFRDNKSGFALTTSASDILINGCQFYSNDNYAIFGSSISKLTVTGCIFDSNKWSIELAGTCSDVLISGNTSLANVTAAIIIGNSCSDVLITGNNLRGQTVTLGSGTNINSVGNL